MNSGRRPEPDALRRDRPSDRDGWTTLPAEGRKGRTPAWPLEPSRLNDPARELEVWARVWHTPQAQAWEQLGWSLDVAMYVRHVVSAERGSMDAAKEARQWSDRLGLNPAAMLRNRWRVASDEVGARRVSVATPAAVVGPAESIRDRLRAVGGGA